MNRCGVTLNVMRVIIILKFNKKKGLINMKNYEKLKEINKKLIKLRDEKEDVKKSYYDNVITQKEYYKKYEDYEINKRLLEIEENIVKNNLYVEVHTELMKIYKEVFKKYENKNIGEKRKEEIQNTLREAIKNIIDYDDNIPSYNRFYLYFNVNYKKDELKCFTITIDKIHYDFTYYLEDDEVKSYYNVEIPKYVENVEEEAKRLLKIYDDTKYKKEEIEKVLDELKSNLSKNFIKNLYNDEISKLNRILTLYW